MRTKFFIASIALLLSITAVAQEGLAELLAQLPQESIARPQSDITIGYHIDSLYYQGEFKGCELKLPTTIGGKEELFILDNGCAFFSAASETFAIEHGIHPIGVSGKAAGTVESVSMWLGIADTMSIGDMQFHNIVFTVIPDVYLENPVVKIEAMLGANICRLIGDMDFDMNKKTVTFPYEQQEMPSNLFVTESGNHYAQVLVGQDTLMFQLDLGASSSELTANYYERYKDDVINHCTADTAMYGGVGGISKEPVYYYNTFTFNSCGGTYVRSKTKVCTTHKPNSGDEYGVLGLDFLLGFDKALLNLNKMFLYVKNEE